MEKTTIGVRDVDAAVFRKFRAFAIERNEKLGDAITAAMKKAIRESFLKDLEAMAKEGAKRAAVLGIKEEDVQEIIHRHRKAKAQHEADARH